MKKKLMATLRGGPCDGKVVEIIGVSYWERFRTKTGLRTAEYLWNFVDGQYYGDFNGYLGEKKPQKPKKGKRSLKQTPRYGKKKKPS